MDINDLNWIILSCCVHYSLEEVHTIKYFRKNHTSSKKGIRYSSKLNWHIETTKLTNDTIFSVECNEWKNKLNLSIIQREFRRRVNLFSSECLIRIRELTHRIWSVNLYSVKCFLCRLSYTRKTLSNSNTFQSFPNSTHVKYTIDQTQRIIS